MLGEVHHIGYRVNNLEQTIAEYQKLFGSTVVSRFNRPDGTAVAFITMGSIQLELIQKASEPGQHLDHVAYLVDDLNAEIAALKAKGGEFATQEPVDGRSGTRYIFLNMMGSRIQIYRPTT